MFSGKKYFLCRHCYQLSYTSSQESHKERKLFNLPLLSEASFAAKYIADLLKGETLLQAIEAIRTGDRSKLPRRLKKRLRAYANLPENVVKNISRFQELEDKKAAEHTARYANYLTSKELCEQSKLTPDEFSRLQTARLLLPDYGGRYRPKLLGWAMKLGYLIKDGWSIEEIRRWSTGRWSVNNPRQWPPDRKDWQELLTHGNT